MDDYLSKPVKARQLLVLLEKNSSIKNLRIDSQHDSELSRSAPKFPLPTGDLRELSTIRQRRTPIDVHTLTAQFSDNLALGIALLEEFAKTAHDRVEALANQVAQGNLNEVTTLAHSLKGVVAMLAMRPLFEVLDNMESAIRDQDIETLRSLVPVLRNEMQRVLDDIPTVRAMTLRNQAVEV